MVDNSNEFKGLFEAEIATETLKTAQPQPKVTGSYIKARLMVIILEFKP